MRTLRKKSGRRGFSLLEVVMSMSIVTISFWGAMAGLQFMWRGITARKVYSGEVAMVQKVFTNIRSNPAQFYAMPSTPDETKDGALVTAAEFPVPDSQTGEYSTEDLAKFQYAYTTNGSYFGTSSDCVECDGRLMYILQPYGSQMPGVLKATVRMVRLKGKKLIKSKEFVSFVNYN